MKRREKKPGGGSPGDFLISGAALEAPNRPALVAPGCTWTFGRLREEVRHVDRNLRLAEFAPDDRLERQNSPRVVVVGHARLPQIVAIYALVERGIPFALIQPRWLEAERELILQRLHPELVIEDSFELSESGGPDTKSREAAAVEDGVADGVTTASGAEPELEVPSPESVLAVLFTSGTGGRPKGARLSRRAFQAAAEASEKNLGWIEGDRWLMNLSPAHVGGLSILLRCLHGRRTLVLADPGPFQAKTFLRQVERDEVTLASLVPTMLHRVLDGEPLPGPPKRLRAILLGGARCPVPLLEKAADSGWPVLTTYGLTEACSQVTTQRSGTVQRGEVGSGSPLGSVEIRIAEPDDEGVGPIELRGRGLFDGYLPGDSEVDRGVGVVGPSAKVPESETPFASAESTEGHEHVEPALLQKLSSGPDFDKQGWFRTGDFGRFDSRGNLHVLDRRTDLIVSGGENVYPSEIEAVLEEHPGVEAACVFGVDDPLWGERVAAIVVRRLRSLSKSRLKEHVAAHLAGPKRPRLLAFVESLPVAANGKIDRRLAKEQVAGRLGPI